MFLILILISPIIAAIIAAIAFPLQVGKEYARLKRQDDSNAVAALEMERAENDLKELERQELERQLAHYEQQRKSYINLYATSTARQQITIDNKIFTLDSKIDKLNAELRSL